MGREIKKPDWNDPELNKEFKSDMDANCLANDEFRKKKSKGSVIKGNTDEDKENAPIISCDAEVGTAEYIEKYGITEADVLHGLYNNEDGDRALFIKVFRNQLTYDPVSGLWYYWNDHYWREDIRSHRYLKLMAIIDIYDHQHSIESIRKDLYEQRGNKNKMIEKEKLCKNLKARITALQTMNRKNNIMTASAQGMGGFCISGNEWDNKPLSMGFKNGVVNLITGEFDGSGDRQGDYIKTVSPIDFPEDIIITKDIDLSQYCPVWVNTLGDIFYGRPEMVPFMQRLLGYALRGDTPEHIYPVFYGPEGRNGKGTILETVKYILGRMAYKAPSDFLIAKNTSQQSSGAADASIMSLRGARLVFTSETNEGDRLDAAKLKELSGGDTISARAPYGRKQVEFTATHTLFTMTNLRIRMPPNDKALWERVLIIAFLMRFIDNPDPTKSNELKADKKLMEKLKAEAKYIAAWMVQGSMIYDDTGLQVPESVGKTSVEYQENEDILKDFLDECCVLGEASDSVYRTTSKILYAGYKEWCKEVGHKAMAKKKFRECMSIKFEEKKDGPSKVKKFFGVLFYYENVNV